ncbi:hypothetical protein [Spirosoma spitsbergense]|uniref:hypothetical protein n=1 Tax=Spirosoma spitsbergense TaxID=431554 RepID=UPI00037C3920|nr:hypothetical protein [Spirosoma spitsbergense]
MQSVTTFQATPDDLEAMLHRAIMPLTDRIRELELMAGSRKHAYTVAEVAQQIGYKSATVLTFIHQGRKARNGKTIKLPHKEPTAGDYRILPADLDTWLSHF